MVRDGAIVVVSPLPDTPAERAGIQAGDRIVEVDGKSTEHFTQDDAVRALRGREGTQVSIRVVRAGATDLLSFTITRARIHSRSVRTVMMLTDRVGYIELNPFSQSSADELQTAVDSLKGAGMRSLVLDLRNNPGGLLDEGIAVADLFLNPGQELVNGYSASASEIVAGALQDHDRALLIGTPTFGKGLVQTVFRLGDSLALKLTTARWYTPSGRSIQRPSRVGFEPDILPEDSTPPADTATQPSYRTDGGRIVRGGGGITPDIVIRQDSADIRAAERLTQVLGRNIAKYQDAMAAAAFQARQRFGVSGPLFAFTSAMRAALVDQLQQRGIDLDVETLRVAGAFLDKQLADQIARLNFGRQGELRREAQDDPTLEEALRVAGRARTPADLLGFAGPAQGDSARRP
jgi:carboxyl-terminal processing protease